MSDAARALLARLSRPPERPRDEDLTAREVWADLVEVESLVAGLLTTLAGGGRVEAWWAAEVEEASYGRDGWEARWPDRAAAIDDALDLFDTC